MATLVIDPLAPRLRIAAFEEGRRRYDQDMAYQREQDAYKRQMDEERLNYDRMNNDRQYRFNRDKFNWARQDADRSYALNKRNMDFNYERGVKLDAREDADRWALGLNRGEYQRALAVTDGTAQPYYPENAINPYQREAVRLRRAGEEQAALNYERQQQAAQQKHDWAMEAATGAALRQAQSAEAKAQEQSRYNHGMLAIQSELGKYTLSEGVKPEAAARVIYDIARQRNISPAEAVREVARIYGWPGGDEAETAAAQENQGGGQPVGPGVSLNSKAGTGRPGGLPGGTHGQTRTGTEGTDEHGSGVDGHGLSKEGTDGGVGTKEYRRAGDLYRGNVARIDNARERLRELTNGAFGAQTEYQRRGKPFLFTDRGYTREQEQFEFQKANQEEYEQLLNEIKKLEAENLELEKKYQRIGNPQAGFRRIKPNDTKR